jgi:ATP-dependent DNA ligase
MHRKRVLRHVLDANRIGSLLYADYAEENGVGLYKAVCSKDLEGIVAKHKQGPYTSAPQSWFKVINPNYSQHVGRREMFDRFRERQESSTL